MWEFILIYAIIGILSAALAYIFMTTNPVLSATEEKWTSRFILTAPILWGPVVVAALFFGMWYMFARAFKRAF